MGRSVRMAGLSHMSGRRRCRPIPSPRNPAGNTRHLIRMGNFGDSRATARRPRDPIITILVMADFRSVRHAPYELRTSTLCGGFPIPMWAGSAGQIAFTSAPRAGPSMMPIPSGSIELGTLHVGLIAGNLPIQPYDYLEPVIDWRCGMRFRVRMSLQAGPVERTFQPTRA